MDKPLLRCVALTLAFFGASASANAGELTAPAGPEAPESAMFSLEALYNRLTTGAPGSKRRGPFQQPGRGPVAGTMHSLDALMARMPQIDPDGAAAAHVLQGRTFWGLRPGSGWGYQTGSYPVSAVPRTGQTTSYGFGDDGDLRKGMEWPTPRFIDHLDGTVTDQLTGLIWLKNANCFGALDWKTALKKANALHDGCPDCSEIRGDCGLSDASGLGQWRMPNIKELQSLVDFGRESPALPPGHPFTSVQSVYFWSSTSLVRNPDLAWFLLMHNGFVNYVGKFKAHHLWPVRGGH